MAENSPETAESPRRGGLWVVGLLLAIATVLAIFASYRFSASERYLTGVHEAFVQRGQTLSVDQCVDEVLDWRSQCEAMKSLCDSNVERMMDACLNGQDRSAWCGDAGDAFGDSHFAATACSAHGIDRSDRGPWKFCGMAYRSIDMHCRTLRKRIDG